MSDTPTDRTVIEFGKIRAIVEHVGTKGRPGGYLVSFERFAQDGRGDRYHVIDLFDLQQCVTEAIKTVYFGDTDSLLPSREDYVPVPGKGGVEWLRPKDEVPDAEPAE